MARKTILKGTAGDLEDSEMIAHFKSQLTMGYSKLFAFECRVQRLANILSSVNKNIYQEASRKPESKIGVRRVTRGLDYYLSYWVITHRRKKVAAIKILSMLWVCYSKKDLFTVIYFFSGGGSALFLFFAFSMF